MGIKNAQIVLDSQFNTYYPGQTVNGRIEYEFDSVKKVRGIYVRAEGEAHTGWSEERNTQMDVDNNQTQSDSVDQYTGHEQYFNNQYYIMGGPNANESELPAGTHSFNFQFTLPPVLPSSFEGKYGYVRYTVKVVLDRPWKFDQTTKMAFTVINPLDLNLNPSYRQPIHIQMEKTFCCLFCASAPLSVDARAPVSGYVPGQAIPVTVDVDNKSNVQVHLVKAALRRVVTFRATGTSTAESKTRVEKDVVTTVQEGPVCAGDTRHYDLVIQVPPIPPSNLVNCHIIDLDYELKVTAKVSGLHTSLHAQKYVTIGTVPLMGAPSSAPAQPPSPSAVGGGGGEAGWNISGGQPPYQSLYPDLSDPVYKPFDAASVPIVTRGEAQNTRAERFTPNYPTYAVLPPPLPQ